MIYEINLIKLLFFLLSYRTRGKSVKKTLLESGNSGIMHDNTASKVIFILQEELESSLRLVHAVATGATGALCVTHRFGQLRAPLHVTRWDSARARADLAASLLHQLGLESAGQ